MGLFSFGSRFSSKNDGKDYFSSVLISPSRSYSVTEEQALSIPAVKSCVELITSSIAQLPIYLYEENSNGEVNKINDSRVDLLNDKSNQFETGYKTKKMIVKDLLFYGKAYLYKANNKLHYLPADKIREEKYTNDGITIGKIDFVYSSPVKTVTLSSDELIIFDAGNDGILVDGSDVLEQALNELEYSKNILKNGALPIGILKASSRLTQSAIDRLRSAWENLYVGTSKAGKTIILEEGLEYEPISMNPNDLQLNETSKTTLSSICRLFNLPEAMINSNANKYSSLEMQNIQFLQYTVAPIINVIESSLNDELLNDFEKRSGFYFRFDTSEILRTTEKEKVDVVTTLVDKGLISFNEARSKLDMPKVENDYFKLNLGSALLDPTTGALTIINLGQELKKGVGQSNEDGTKKQQD
ncbi:phage portal protein [Bacillus smithii]|uniref:phage portal protein n=1 Tax=Bacillus smithii TaxID=1479 RepID=UPI003D259CB9